MTKEIVEELTSAEQDEKDEQAYLKMFNEEEKALSAGHEPEPSSVDDDAEGSPDDKDPEPDAAKPATDKGTAGDEKNGEADDPYAWIDDLSPEAQEQAKALQHMAATNTGRLSALQRRLNDAEAREYARAATQATERAKSAPAKSPEKPKEDPKELSTKLQEFVDTYPQLAESVKEMVANDRADMEAMIDERLRPINEEAAFQKESEARQRLESGASKIFDTPKSNVHYKDILDSDLYKDTFLQSQPAEFVQMATTTTDPDTALWVLQTFATWAEGYAKDNGLMDEEPTGTTKTKADKASARRSSSKETAANVDSRSAVTDPDDTLDYETLFRREAVTTAAAKAL